MNTKQTAIIITALALIALTIGCKTNGKEKTIKPVKVKTVETHTGTTSVRFLYRNPDQPQAPPARILAFDVVSR